jgi:hypothetical protein
LACFLVVISKITGLIIASSVGLVFFAALTVVGVTPSQMFPSFYAFWFCALFISLNYIALTHVLSFHPLKIFKSTGSQNSSADGQTSVPSVSSLDDKPQNSTN